MRKLKKALIIATLIYTGSQFLFCAYAAVSLERTRIIFNGNEKSISININNSSNKIPYLAQSWLEDVGHKKMTDGALVVTPPVQRLEPEGNSMILISTTSSIYSLPQDRESLFYLNLREIPPRSEKDNVLQIALQSKVKLFYRPKDIVVSSGEVWQSKLILHEEVNGYRIENPTPYYITVIGLAGSKSEAENGRFESFMVSPKSSESIKIGHFSTPYLNYINDYGGRPVLKFTCESKRCSTLG